MRKEQFVAIILGSIIGVAVAFSLWRLSRGTVKLTQNTPSAETSQETGTQANVTNDFAIVSPSDFAVVDSDSIQVTGFANSNSTIAVYADDVSITKANSSGEFSVEADLASGINKIKIWSFETGQEPRQMEITVVYTNQLETTDAATSLFGTVTDITEENLQVRAPSGEIAQLAISANTSYVKVLDDTEEIEFSDVAIGDYIAALGQMNNNVMSVARVLVTTQPENNDGQAISGTIQTLSASEFYVATSGNEQVSIDATGSVTTYSAKEAEITSTRLSTSEEGDAIVVIGSFEDDELVADTIILL